MLFRTSHGLHASTRCWDRSSNSSSHDIAAMIASSSTQGPIEIEARVGRMAIIARRPDHGSKGLIVLTHKERATFGAPVMRSGLEMMRDEYVILMHWGHHHSDVDDPWYVDAHLAGPTTISFRTEDARHIPCAVGISSIRCSRMSPRSRRSGMCSASLDPPR